MSGDFCHREGTGAIHLNGVTASKPNIGASMLERLRACATCSRSSTTAALHMHWPSPGVHAAAHVCLSPTGPLARTQGGFTVANEPP